MSSWLSSRRTDAKRATNILPQFTTEPELQRLINTHAAHKQLIQGVVSASREYTQQLQLTAQKEEALFLAIATLYDAGTENDLSAANVNLATLHPTSRRNPRSLDLTKKLTPSMGGAGSDSCTSADFSSNLLEGWANGVTSELTVYMRAIDSISVHVDNFVSVELVLNWC